MTNQGAWLVAMITYSFLSAGTLVWATGDIFACVLIVPSLVLSYGVYSFVMWKDNKEAGRR